MTQKANRKYHALALFSGGLDSILSIKTIQEQGLKVLGLHFYSPFFGSPHRLEHWEKVHGLDLLALDISREYVEMLCSGPEFGLGKLLNPCIDCKIFMLQKARDLLGKYGAEFVISGEVLGQRPMSQRRDALFAILREAGVKDILLRPLSARHLPPTRAEREGLVDREKLQAFSGRGRKDQMALARKFNITEIPTPAGGCRLTDQESCKRYLPLLQHHRPGPEDFVLANQGRQFWYESLWMSIGRDKQDNKSIEEMAREDDYVFRLKMLPGPTGLGRNITGSPWPGEVLQSAAALVAHYSPKARKSPRRADVLLMHKGEQTELSVRPGAEAEGLIWDEPRWDQDAARRLFAVTRGQRSEDRGQRTDDG